MQVTAGGIDAQNRVFAGNQAKMGLLNEASTFATSLNGDIFSPKYAQGMSALAAKDKSLALQSLTDQTTAAAYNAQLEGAKKALEKATGKDSTFSVFA